MGGGGDFWTSPITQTIIGSLGGLRVGPHQMVMQGGGFRPFLPAQLYSGFKTQEEALKSLEGIIPTEMMPYVKYHTMLTGQPPSLASVLPFIEQQQKAKGTLEALKSMYGGKQTQLPPELQLSLDKEIPTKISHYEQVMNWKPELTPPTALQEGGKEGVATPTTLKPPTTLTPPREQNKLKLKFENLSNVSPLISSIDFNKFEELVKKYPSAADAILKVAETTAKGDIVRNVARNSGLSEENIKTIDLYSQTGNPEKAMEILATALGNKEVAKITNDIFGYLEKGKFIPPELLGKAVEAGLSPKIVDDLSGIVNRNLALQIAGDPKKIDEVIDKFVKMLDPYINSKDPVVKKTANLYFSKTQIEAMRQLAKDMAQNVLRTSGKLEDLYNTVYGIFDGKFKEMTTAVREALNIEKTGVMQAEAEKKQEITFKKTLFFNNLNELKKLQNQRTQWKMSGYDTKALDQEIDKYRRAVIDMLPTVPLDKYERKSADDLLKEDTTQQTTGQSPKSPDISKMSWVEKLYYLFKP